jgi:hypothetical protein
MALCGAIVSGGATSGRSNLGPPWTARVAIAGSFSGLVAADGSLYATRGSRNQLVRIDPATGRVERTATRGTTVESIAYAGGAIWTTGVPTSNRAAPYSLIEFNATTLVRERVMALGGEYKPVVFSGPNGELWSGTGSSQLGACIVRRLSPVSGASVSARRLWVKGTSAGGCSNVSFAPDGRFLFLLTGSGGTNNLVLYKLDVRSLGVVAHRTLPAFAMFGSVAASNTRVWLAGGYPGAPGDLLFLDGSSLRTLAESPDQATPGSKVSTDLPEFSQWPALSSLDGHVWVGSDGTDACFALSSRRTLAIATETRSRVFATGPFAELGGKFWAIGHNASGSQQQDLVRVDPPKICTT